MNKIVQAAWIGIALAPVFVIGGCAYRWWQFDHLEDRARQAVTAAELQTWATNLLARFPAYSPSQVHQSRTNFPEKLAPLCHGPGACWVSVNLDPPCVAIIWSMKPSRDAGFEIGPTNFTGTGRNPRSHAWAPGVYFYRR